MKRDPNFNVKFCPLSGYGRTERLCYDDGVCKCNLHNDIFSHYADRTGQSGSFLIGYYDKISRNQDWFNTLIKPMFTVNLVLKNIKKIKINKITFLHFHHVINNATSTYLPFAPTYRVQRKSALCSIFISLL
jgi:hypothetical protein